VKPCHRTCGYWIAGTSHCVLEDLGCPFGSSPPKPRFVASARSETARNRERVYAFNSPLLILCGETRIVEVEVDQACDFVRLVFSSACAPHLKIEGLRAGAYMLMTGAVMAEAFMVGVYPAQPFEHYLPRGSRLQLTVTNISGCGVFLQAHAVMRDIPTEDEHARENE
jgi:hypothetical protein